MTEYQSTDTTLQSGDTLELGDIVTDRFMTTTGGSPRYLAVHEGDTTEYVVIRRGFDDVGDVDTPNDARWLGIVDGSGMASPSAILLVPKGAYHD